MQNDIGRQVQSNLIQWYEELSDLHLLMLYTGWSMEIARAATMEAECPDWNVRHLIKYLVRGRV